MVKTSQCIRNIIFLCDIASRYKHCLTVTDSGIGLARLATREREKEEAAKKKAAEANTEKWEKKVQDLQGKIKAKKGFIEEQNNIQKTALAKGEKMKSADALRQNLRAAELARMTVERESKDLYDLQEQLARHMGKKPKNS